jgi:Protein of unknown function (DUF2892)
MNVEPLDRIIRIVIGLTLITITLLMKSNWRWAGLIGILALASGIAG